MTKTKKNKHFEEFSEAAQVEIYRSASLQLNIVKLRLRFYSSKYSCHFQILYTLKKYSSTRPGVQQCQAQGMVFCPRLGLI